MGVIRSFSYGKFKGIDEIPTECWNLFVKNAFSMDEKEKEIEYGYEIVSAYLNGNINPNEPFNLKGYEYKINTNKRKGQIKKAQKELFLDDDAYDDNGGAGRTLGGVTGDAVVAYQKTVALYADAYEALVDNYELNYALETISSLKDDILIEENVDIIECVKQAMRGLPAAVKALKSICEDYELLGEQIKLILSSGVEFDQLWDDNQQPITV